jgi:hypothetical protein
MKMQYILEKSSKSRLTQQIPNHSVCNYDTRFALITARPARCSELVVGVTSRL